MIKFKELPTSVKQFVQHYNAWITGTAADPNVNSIDDIDDIDVIIPFREWNKATGLIPDDAKKNKYGGWKYKDGNIFVDVWPNDLNSHMLSVMPKYLWQPRYDIMYKNITKLKQL